MVEYYLQAAEKVSYVIQDIICACPIDARVSIQLSCGVATSH